MFINNEAERNGKFPCLQLGGTKGLTNRCKIFLEDEIK
jgi:hypothetical protein